MDGLSLFGHPRFNLFMSSLISNCTKFFVKRDNGASSACKILVEGQGSVEILTSLHLQSV